MPESKSPNFLARLLRAVLLAALPILVAFSLGARLSISPFELSYAGTTGASQFLQALLQDLAVGVLIAWAVKEMIERDYERRQQAAMVAAADGSRRAVLRALFGTFFDEETVEEIYKTIFSSTLIRTEMTVRYRLYPHAKSEWLVNLEVELEYKIGNIATSTTAHFNPSTSVSNYAAIFRDDPGLQPPRLKSVKVGKRTLSRKEIEALNAAVDASKESVVFPLEGAPIKSGHSLDIRITYEREKLVCDAEVMRMSYPTKKVTVTVDNGCFPGLDVGIKEIGQQGFTPKDPIDLEGAKWKCVHEGILLENNGWVLFWNDPRLRPSEIPGPRLRPVA